MKDKQTPREIPNQKDPRQDQPEKAPSQIPDAEPGEDNPTNPKEDEV